MNTQQQLEEVSLLEKYRLSQMNLSRAKETLKTMEYRMARLKNDNRALKYQNDNLKLKLKRETEEMPLVSLSDIVKDVINKMYNVNIDYKTRQRTTVQARMMYYAYMRKNTLMSLKEICYTIGFNPHHSTLLFALKTHNDLLEYNKKYIKEWVEFSENIKVKLSEVE
jgi:chromosomal replication initiation ATPase DnaA